MTKVLGISMMLVVMAALMLVAGCTYGPPEERANIRNVAVRPGTYQFAVAVRHAKFQNPTGINTFPNGGVNRFLEQVAIVYLVDVSKNDVVEIARIKAPEQLKTSFDVHLAGWKGERVFVQISGCPGRECYGDLVQFRYFEMGGESLPVRITSPPEKMDYVPGMLARAPDEEVYMRVRADSHIINLRTEESHSFVDLYKVENSGELVVITPCKALQPTPKSGATEF
jgi:hypothetical protein